MNMIVDFEDDAAIEALIDALNEIEDIEDAVSYTHLTLPTICSV